jgi:hypothetical protein
MTAVRCLTEEEWVRRGVKALVNELEPFEAMRFLNLLRAKRLESVRRHRRWQATLDQWDIFAQVFQVVPSDRPSR